MIMRLLISCLNTALLSLYLASAHAVNMEVRGQHQRADGSTHNFDVVDGDALNPGDRFQIILSTDRQIYYSVIYVSRNGEIAQIFPPGEQPGVSAANLQQYIPGNNNYFELDSNSGRELMYIITDERKPENLPEVLRQAQQGSNTPAEIHRFLKGHFKHVNKMEIINTGKGISGLRDNVAEGLVQDIVQSYSVNPWSEHQIRQEEQDARRRSADNSIPEEVRRRAQEVRALLHSPSETPSGSSLRTVSVTPGTDAIATERKGPEQQERLLAVRPENEQAETGKLQGEKQTAQRLREQHMTETQVFEDRLRRQQQAPAIAKTEEARRIAEQAAAEEARRKTAEEARRIAAAEARRLEAQRTALLQAEQEAQRREEERKAAEAARLERERRLAAEEVRRIAEQATAEEARRRETEEARRIAAAEARRLEAQRTALLQAEQEAQRREEERKAAEAARLEKERRLAAEEVRRIAEQATAEEARRKAAEEARRIAAAEARRLEAQRTALLQAEQEAQRREEERKAAEAARLERERRLAAEEVRRPEEQRLAARAEAIRLEQEREQPVAKSGIELIQTEEADTQPITVNTEPATDGLAIQSQPDDTGEAVLSGAETTSPATPARPREAVVVLRSENKPVVKPLPIPAPQRQIIVNSSPGEEHLRDLYARIASAIVSIRTDNDEQAAGFILNKQGNILTGWHVVAGVNDIDVEFMAISGSPRSYKARVIKQDKFRDLALLELANPPVGIEPIQMAALTLPEVGTQVRVFGQKNGQVWATDNAMITRVAENFTWFSASNVIHRGEILQIDLPADGKNIGSLVTGMDYRMLGIKSFSGRQTGKTYAVSTRTINDFLNAE